MTRRSLVLSLAVMALAEAGCGLRRTDGVTATPTAAQVRNATITGVYERPVVLRDGVYQGSPFVEGGASRPSLVLMQNLIASGNFDGAAGEEAAVLLAESSGASGERIYLVILGMRDSSPANLGAIQVGDRSRIRSLGTSGADIVVDVIEAGPNEAACCPTQAARKIYGFENGVLKMKSSIVTGTQSLELLAGVEWGVVEIDDKPLPDMPKRPTATVEGGRISGFSGCNRYSAALQEAAPGQIAVGPIAGTRMACPESETQLEIRFLESLAKVTKYSFVAGRLLLSGMDGVQMRSVLLTRK